MDSDDLDALAAPMLDDLAAVLATYGVDANDPEAQLRVVASLCGVLLTRTEDVDARRRPELQAMIERALAVGAALRPAWLPRCPCTREAA